MKPRILLIEDDLVVERILRKSLRTRYAFEAIHSCVGLASALERFHPDLIILDVGLPWLNGFELCRDLRRNKRYRHLPVLFLSALSEAEDVAAGMRSGGNGYLSKPFRLPQLRQEIERLLS